MGSYNLSPKNKEKTSIRSNRKFSKDELMEMSNYELRKICLDHKIINAYTGQYSKEDLVDIILKYRGIKKSYLINKFKKGGIEAVQQILMDNSLEEMPHRDKIKIPAKIIVYKELGVKNEDLYEVKIENKVQESNVLLMNGDRYVCGIMNIVRSQEGLKDFLLVANSQNLRLEGLQNKKYSLIFFNKTESEYIYKAYYSAEKMPPRRLHHYRVPILNLEIRELERTDTVLGIDFGTSNTTAGAYLDRNYVSNIAENDVLNEKLELNQVNFVNFLDHSEEQQQFQEIIPTTVYIKDCSDPENIEYLFGYEAKQHIKKNEYTGKASLYHGIKRWVTTYQKQEEIYDEYGNSAKITRGEIIREYVNHIVESAEHQFKCRFNNVHISSPVKLKEQYLSIFQEILPEIELQQADALDEGMAVLYNTIANQMEKRSFANGEFYKALVIDCGGGTTDLSSCKFKIEERDISYKVDIKTTFENGDTNFGGNNITFRIMQYMKIVFAYYYQDEQSVDIDDIIGIPACDIFRHVDESGVREIYSDLEKEYQRAENIIPTKYKEYENKTSEEYRKVRNNFYFLWEIAENMKKRFFEKTNILRNKFDSSNIDSEDSDLHITRLRKWSLSLKNSGNFTTLNDFPKIVFNIKEINKLIKADIYAVVKEFLEELYESRALMEYSIIKLTGQSCKIDIFKEALKEFVAGRSIKFKQKRKEEQNRLNLKLSCLKGVLRYLKSKRFGQIEVTIENDDPTIPYSVSGYNHRGEVRTVIDSHQKVTEAIGTISKPISVQEVKFLLKRDGVVHKEYIYKNKLAEYEVAEVQNITQQYPKISQKDTDTIRNGEIKFFLFSNSDKWGVYTLPILRKDDQLYRGQQVYYPFDYEVAEMNFFDGLH